MLRGRERSLRLLRAITASFPIKPRREIEQGLREADVVTVSLGFTAISYVIDLNLAVFELRDGQAGTFGIIERPSSTHSYLG